MEKEYIIHKVDSLPDQDTWSRLPKALIENFPWDKSGYRPRAEASVCYTDAGLHVHFTTWENSITVRNFRKNNPVYQDSCVEFFLNAMPEEGTSYLNFETNAAGAMLLGMGSNRGSRGLLEDADHSRFNIRSSVPEGEYHSFTGPLWTIDYTIPFDFIREKFAGFEPRPGKQLKGNFYKCGDKTEYPHYGCWNPIENPSPDFHRPEFFGRLVLG